MELHAAGPIRRRHPRTNRIGMRCHAPTASFASASADGTLSPSASAAALWAGRGGGNPQTGAPLAIPSAHGAIDDGCIGCHSAGPSILERGASHGFTVDVGKCAGCHRDAVPDSAAIDRDLHEQAAALLATLAHLKSSVLHGRPQHAERVMLPNDRVGRAIYDALLVFEDPAAAAHNAPYARALLEAARSAQEEDAK